MGSDEEKFRELEKEIRQLKLRLTTQEHADIVKKLGIRPSHFTNGLPEHRSIKKQIKSAHQPVKKSNCVGVPDAKIDTHSTQRQNYDSLNNEGKKSTKQNAALHACKKENLHVSIRDIEVLFGLPEKSLNRDPYKSIIDRGRSKERQERGEVRKRKRKDRVRRGTVRKS